MPLLAMVTRRSTLTVVITGLVGVSGCTLFDDGDDEQCVISTVRIPGADAASVTASTYTDC